MFVAALLALIGFVGSCTEAPRSEPGKEATRAMRLMAKLTPMAERSIPVCAVVAVPSASAGAAPMAIQFAAEGACTGTEGTFTWDFGDGSAPVHARNAAHLYQTPGRYTARVTLVDGARTARDADETVITVSSD
jgi:hypothetical protein